METLEEFLQSITEAYDHYYETKHQLDSLQKGRVDDYSLIPGLYEEYLSIAERYHFQNDQRSGNRKQFLFVMLALYSPSSLFGAALSKGLRNAITETFGNKSSTLIYETRDLAVSWYKTYSGFKGETNIAYSEIVRFIKKIIEYKID